MFAFPVTDRISLSVSQQQKQAALDGVAAVRAAVPGLIALAPGEGRELYHFVNRPKPWQNCKLADSSQYRAFVLLDSI